MPVQVAALAVVVGNAVTGVEFEPAGDAHEGSGVAEERAIISPRAGGYAPRPRVQREARPDLPRT
jgi:hypothetical protein